MAKWINPFRANAHAISQAEHSLRRAALHFCSPFGLANNRVVPLAVQALPAGKHFETVYSHQTFDENIEQLDKKSEFLN
jgi:hypothetical protein